MATEETDRATRERLFHDAAYSDARRERVTRFYTVTTASSSSFRQVCLDHARSAEEILEYGCGEGSLAVELALGDTHVTGIDISPVAIEHSSERAARAGASERTSFLVMDAEHLAFESNSFDLVCGMAILHHLDLSASYAEIARVLRPAGTALFLEPLGHNPAINWYRSRTPELRTPDEAPLRIGDIELARQFFERVEVSYFELSTLLAIPLSNVPGFRRFVRLLAAIDRGLFAIFPPVRKHAWFAILQMHKPSVVRSS